MRSHVKLDEVHGGHGEASAVHEASDVAVERDVVYSQFMSTFIALGSRYAVIIKNIM